MRPGRSGWIEGLTRAVSEIEAQQDVAAGGLKATLNDIERYATSRPYALAHHLHTHMRSHMITLAHTREVLHQTVTFYPQNLTTQVQMAAQPSKSCKNCPNLRKGHISRSSTIDLATNQVVSCRLVEFTKIDNCSEWRHRSSPV